MQKFCVGDHLVTKIDDLGLLKHHGLYVGNGYVIHLAKTGVICEDPLLVFSDNQEIHCIGTADYCEQAVRRARRQIGQCNYQLFRNNCEHFVNWCLAQASTSDQVSNALHLTVQGVARSGVAGEVCKRIATTSFSNIALLSMAAKLTADYLGAPKPVSTLIGTPGDLIAKPVEALLDHGLETFDEVTNHLSSRDYGTAASRMVTGCVKIVSNVAVVAPFHVAENALKAGIEIGQHIWWRLKY